MPSTYDTGERRFEIESYQAGSGAAPYITMVYEVGLDKTRRTYLSEFMASDRWKAHDLALDWLDDHA